MYSAFIYYFLLVPRRPSEVRAFEDVSAVVMALPGAVETGVGLFELRANARSHSIVAAHADEHGNYVAEQGLSRGVNLIAVTGSKDQEVASFLAPIRQLAKQLRWTLMEEEDEDGNEMVVHWEPHLEGDS